ncbi:MAG: hypothetical protein O3B01_27980 [Planctomycetota bacterium]|nr:hypothetical protein [Planctomycetota bacterium]
MKNEEGIWYYTSRPPMAWLAPYFAFRLVGVYPDVLPLQIFNLVLHFICVLLIYLIVHQLLRDRSVAAREPPAFIAAAMYIFNPFTLWFHCNTYSAQWLNHPLLLAGTYVFVRILDSEESDRKRWILGFGVLIFFMFYTAWYGVFFSTIVCLYALIHHQERSMRWLIVATVAGIACAMTLAFIQMSSIAGLEALIEFFFGRFTFISGYFEETDKNMHIYDLVAWKRVFNHYYKGFGGFLIFFPAVLFVAAALSRGFERLDKRQVAVACLTVLTVLGHHMTLFNHTTIHEYSVMPMFIAFSILTGLGLSSVISKLEETRNHKELVGNIASILVVVLLLSFISIGDYRDQNSNGHSLYKAMGETIRKNAKDDEVVFVEKLSLYLTGYGSVVPHVVFYAHRNIATWEDAKSAQDLLDANGARRGIIFKLVKVGNQYKFPYRYVERSNVLSKQKTNEMFQRL